jgi:hypothetical protein
MIMLCIVMDKDIVIEMCTTYLGVYRQNLIRIVRLLARCYTTR